jgi:prepilin-type N-terminal cleavage/methylation domain-containing protein
MNNCETMHSFRITLVRRRRAFTLIELLVVIAIISILAGLLLPVLAGAKLRAKKLKSLSNLKQLGVAAQLYINDNNGYFAMNNPTAADSSNSWIQGNMNDSLESTYGEVTPGVLDSTNPVCITSGSFWNYDMSFGIYQCPADPSQTGGIPHVRSYSMNGWIGGTHAYSSSLGVPTNQEEQFQIFLKENTMQFPSQTWYLIDEHELSINDGWFWVDMTGTRPFSDMPATHFNRSYVLSFCDGHAEAYKLMDPRTGSTVPARGNINTPPNPDYSKIQAVTTRHI